MTRIGGDGRKIPMVQESGALERLERAQELGLEGLFFRTAFELSPTLDLGEMRAVREKADDLALYLETGIGKINPFATPEAPELRAAGDGDIVLGFRRIMEACAEIGCHELWVATANYQTAYTGRFRYDRFRTDVSWAEQLEASERFLKTLAPIARDLGIHMNMETHEEITSFEVVRMVEAVGPDVMGVVFDTANVLQRAEHPVRAAQRVAPYVRQTHLKDAHLEMTDEGVDFQLRACGRGVVDFASILPILVSANPNLNLTIENAQPDEERSVPGLIMSMQVFDPDWLAGHPDLTTEEFAAYMRLVRDQGLRVERGQVVGRASYSADAFDVEAATAALVESTHYMRALCDEMGISRARGAA